MKAPLLSVTDVHFAHERGRAVLEGVSLQLMAGEVLVVIGPSGCGKTTLLRCIAGLERPQSGNIELDGAMLSDERVFRTPESRGIGFIFQGLALFPHLTVARNVAFGLHDLPRAERLRKVSHELNSVGLAGMGFRYPHELSGGQQQRVAIARALIRRPRLMLMDEPFSDLDPKTRAEVRMEVLRILRQHNTSAIIVTHDREDAFHAADRIAEMNKGRIVRCAAAEVFRHEWNLHPFEETRSSRALATGGP